jgi:preprotein translocase subunit YajC
VSPGLLIIIALFAVLYFTMIRPQRARAQAQQQMLGAVEPGDEILTVGGIYGIVQEIEPDEEGGDLVVEIADGIHVRIARKALATVVKPEDDDVDGDEDDDEHEGDDGEAAEGSEPAAPATSVEEVTNEGETVNPGAAEQAAPSERS